MTLAHQRYADLFENGYDTLMKTGFWRLKNTNREVIDQLSTDIASRQNGSLPGSSFRSDSTRHSPNGSHVHSSRNGAGKNGDEMNLLASLAAAEESEDASALTSLSNLGHGTRRQHHAHSSNGSAYHDDLEDYERQQHTERRQRISNNFRAAEPKVDHGAHQLRKEYQMLEAKYMQLELEHHGALLQLEKFHTLFLATRKQDENVRVSFAHQAELQESQVRLLLDKVHRLEMELQQQRNTASSSTTVTMQTTQAKTESSSAMAVSAPAAPAAPSQTPQPASTPSVSTPTATTATSLPGMPTQSSVSAPPAPQNLAAQTLSAASMLGVNPLAAKLGLLPTANPYNTTAALYNTIPWLAAQQALTNSAAALNWPAAALSFGDLTNNPAAKLQAQQLAQAQQALLMAEALRTNDTITIKTEGLQNAPSSLALASALGSSLTLPAQPS